MKNIQTGDFGEDIACRFLERKGYKILDRNYRKKLGEIDIVAKKGDLVTFIEVKTTIDSFSDFIAGDTEKFRPEERVDDRKLKRFGRVLQVYLEEKSIESDWEFKVLAVIFNPGKKEARVKIIDDVVPE